MPRERGRVGDFGQPGEQRLALPPGTRGTGPDRRAGPGGPVSGALPKIWPPLPAAAKCRTTAPQSTMPTYQYACDDCGASSEVRQRFSEDPLVDCPACGAPSLRRVIFPAGVIFKGSGWYKTDSRPKPKVSETAEAKKEAAAKADSDKSSKSESAPAKSDSKADAKSSTPAGAAAGG